MNINFKKGIKYAAIVVLLVLVTAIHSASAAQWKKDGSMNINSGTAAVLSQGLYNEEEDIAAFKILNKSSSLNFTADISTTLQKYGFKYYTDKASPLRPDFMLYDGSEYSVLDGVTCFRGNNLRDGGSFGTAEVKEEKLEFLWKKDIGAIDSWSGVGWNGQPSIVKWNKSVINNMNIYKDKKAKVDLKEVIYATLDGNVYFLDLEDGKETRDKLNIGAPIKGSLSVDPRGIPLLYVGQGIDTNGGRYVDFAYRIFSLTDYSKLYEFKGKDSFARRDWGAFDSTALIDRYNDYIFICGENGVFYSGKLNTSYNDGKVQVKPDITKYRYDVPGKDKKGIENSIAIYKDYGYFADNDGILQCLNLKTLTPVWTINVKDDTDSTVVLEREDKGLGLYTATEVDHQGPGGYSYVRKIDGTSGRVLWENKYRCAYDENTNGGALATPVLGKNDLSGMIIFNIAKTVENGGGLLIAMDKATGKEIWKLNLKNYCWSSPVAVYSKEGKGYIVQCDSAGNAILIDGKTGKVLDTISLGANVEGTPAAYDDTLVVGTRGCRIIGFKIK